jgi:hypothetical protein
MRPSRAFISRPHQRAWGMPGARCTRSLVCKVLVAHECRHHRSTGITRHSRTRVVLAAYVVCHRHQRIKVLSLPGRADKTSANLTPACGASGPHDFAVRSNISRQHAVDRSQAHHPPCDPIAHKTLPRPPHPTPTSVTIMIRPLWDGMARIVEVFRGGRKPKYFCKEDWTPESTNCPTGKSLEPVLLSTPSVFA